MSTTLPRASGFELPVVVSLGAGAVASAAILAAIGATRPSYLATLMLDRGVCQYVSLFLAAASLVFIVGRAVGVLMGRRALVVARGRPFVRDWPAERELSKALRDELLLETDAVSVRQARALQAYLLTGSRSAAATAAEEDAGLAQQTMEASYTIPRAMVWAIPLMGFIGTVVGISAAVQNFSGFLQQAEEIEQIKHGINGVTTGLAVAFDTTLVALALSVAVMLPLVLIERFEARLLSAIDAFVGDSVVARLPETDSAAALNPNVVSNTIREAIVHHLPSPQAFVAAAEAYVRQAADTIAVSARISAEAATASAHKSAESIAHSVQALREYQTSALAELRMQSQSLAHPLTECAAALEERVRQMAEHARRTDEALALEQQLVRTLGALETSGDLRRTLDGMHVLLRHLVPAVERLGQPREFVFAERPGGTAGNGANPTIGTAQDGRAHATR